MTYGWNMPEESVASALRAGLADVRAAFTAGDAVITELLARVYRNVPKARTEMKAWLAKHEPNILFSYPHDHRQLPCWAILIDPGDQVQQYLGDDGFEDETEDGEKITVSAERWRTTLGIITHDENGDLVRWLHQLAKFFLAGARQDLADDYPHGQHMSERDLDAVSVAGEGGGRRAFRRVLQVVLEGDQTDASRFPVTEEITEATSDGTASTPTTDEQPLPV